MEEKGSIKWINLLLELLVVVGGILIAFGLDAWNTTRNEKDLYHLLLSGVKEELDVNLKEADKALVYHTALLQTLRETPEEARLSLNPADLSNAAWNLAHGEILRKYIDHQTYKALLKSYELQDRLNAVAAESTKQMNQLNIMGPLYQLPMLDKNLSAEQEARFVKLMKGGWIPVFETWTYFEAESKKAIEAALDRLNAIGY